MAEAEGHRGDDGVANHDGEVDAVDEVDDGDLGGVRPVGEDEAPEEEGDEEGARHADAVEAEGGADPPALWGAAGGRCGSEEK